MDNDCECWSNSYVLDGETEKLLRKLQDHCLTDDQVRRFYLKEVDSLLSLEERAELEAEMIRGAARILAFDLQPFADAVAQREQKMERLRQDLDWTEVPPHMRDLSKRRAEYILNYASENGWIERVEDEGTWRISEHGRELLDQGGFYMR